MSSRKRKTARQASRPVVLEALEERALMAADAGGPYAGMEGSAIALVGSGDGKTGLVFDSAAITAILQEVANTDTSVQGISALVGYQGQIVYEQYLDGHVQGQVLDLASATKWMSAMTILTAWDDGYFDLDAPLSSYVPSFAALPTNNLKRTMTMRQLFSHTSGLPTDISRIRQGSLTDIANRVANGTGLNQVNLEGDPGEQYLYGNVSMQTGGGVLEITTGQTWVNWVQQNLFNPMGMTSTFYETSGGRNPLIAGGGKSSITDYGKLMQMILDGGVYNGQQILSTAAIEEMFTPNTEGLPYLNNPPRFPGGLYALGCWTDIFDTEGNPIFVDSPGRSGFIPWINLESRYWGIVMFDSNSRDESLDQIIAINNILQAAIDTPVSYDWDLDNNGTYETSGQSVNFVSPENGVYTVGLRVTGPGGAAFDTATVNVANVAPVASLSGPSDVKRGALTTWTLGATDPSPGDQAAGFTFQIDWNGDGNVDETVSGPAGTSVGRVFDVSGPAQVRLTAVDRDGGASGLATQSVNVVSRELIGGTLYWYGTSGADEVTFTQASPTSVTVAEQRLNGGSVSTNATIAGVTNVVALGRGGNDGIDGSLLTTPVRLEGGTGDDFLRGGAANDVILGESGSDTVWGGLGSDDVQGGSEADLLFGDHPAGETRSLSKSVLGQDTISGGGGNDTIYGDGDGGEGTADTIYGDAGDDIIFGDGSQGGTLVASDVIDGGTENDTITADGAEGAADTIIGGDGDDFLNAGSGNDSLEGGIGNDILLGGDVSSGGNDTLIGGDGRDILVGDGGGANPAQRAGGIDSIVGGAGQDLIVSGFVDTTLFVGQGWLEVRAEWVRSTSLASRVNNIGGSGTGLNGGNKLTVGVTLFSDRPAGSAETLVDQIFGGADEDWIWLDAGVELVSDPTPGDVVSNLSP